MAIMTLGRIQLWLLGACLLLSGLWLTLGGVWLAALGGSVLYAPLGLAAVAASVLLLRRNVWGASLFFIMVLMLALWGLSSVGLRFWLLLPYLGWAAVLAAWLAMPWMWRQVAGSRSDAPRFHGTLRWTGAIVPALVMVVSGLADPEPAGGGKIAALASQEAGDGTQWPVVGRNAAGTRYAPVAQITPANVHELKPVWTYRTGDLPPPGSKSRSAQMFEATPIKVGDVLYLCTPRNIVIALDADTGQELWRHDPQVDAGHVPMLICRGVTYYENPDAGASQCVRRILVATVDARLLALDARTGERCPSFGQGGEISLLEGLGPVKPGHYYVTSPPTIIAGNAVVGGFVLDNMTTDAASGVVRAFDAVTGEQRWAWDPGAPLDAAQRAVAEFSRGSPNAWSLFSADEQLGLVYIPTGNAAPDHFGGLRNADLERHSASVVALDGGSGQLRWSFQTVHRDLWDYDVASQPVLVDLPMGGQTVPALLQPTKHGEIFLLDRRTGEPLVPVREIPVPAGTMAGEHYSATQPASSDALSFTPRSFVETDMWGISALDQLWCRIQFRRLRYEGKFTPPSTQPTLVFPGNNGIMNWGSVSVDERRSVMLVNSSYMPLIVTLVPRADAPQGEDIVLDGRAAISPMLGTPYAVRTERPFVSPLGVPCNAPPWGLLSAVDLKSRTLLWQRPLGTTRDHAPLGVAVPGVFNQGGSVVTAGGVVFIAATLDDYLRAFDVETGKELWKGRLPAGGQATPMTYVSAKTGKQLVVIASGGHQFMQTPISDHVVAYGLPD